ncbi:MAG: hypothetical protein KJS98_10015 [Nitrospirae bacterium]|nr:hypothetical protein [Nitrospirota bacterium]MDE3050536.1 hypothetical protein [Nitrospirota bacterium]
MLNKSASGVLASLPGTVKREARKEDQPRNCSLARRAARLGAPGLGG